MFHVNTSPGTQLEVFDGLRLSSIVFKFKFSLNPLYCSVCSLQWVILSDVAWSTILIARKQIWICGITVAKKESCMQMNMWQYPTVLSLSSLSDQLTSLPAEWHLFRILQQFARIFWTARPRCAVLIDHLLMESYSTFFWESKNTIGRWN